MWLCIKLFCCTWFVRFTLSLSVCFEEMLSSVTVQFQLFRGQAYVSYIASSDFMRDSYLLLSLFPDLLL